MENAYELGQQAYVDGKSQDANPYEAQTDNFYDWEGGWVEAADRDSD